MPFIAFLKEFCKSLSQRSSLEPKFSRIEFIRQLAANLFVLWMIGMLQDLNHPGVTVNSSTIFRRTSTSSSVYFSILHRIFNYFLYDNLMQPTVAEVILI